MKKVLLSFSILVLGLLVGVTNVYAGSPTATLTTPGGGVDSIAGSPTTSGREAGGHSIVITDATASTLTGGDAESDTVADAIAVSLAGTEILTVTIAGEAVTTGALAAATADVTTLAAVATDIQTKINAASTIADVAVSVVGASPAKAFKITVAVAGANNSITSAVTGTGSGSNKTALGTGSAVAGTNANAVDTFTANSGSNGLWVAANGGTTKTIAHAPAAGTASTLAGLKTSLIAAGSMIDGITIGASGVLSAGTALITVAPGAATAGSSLRVTGTASVAAGVENEITVTAYDDISNKITAYTGDKSLTFSGPAVMGANNPQVEAVDVGSAVTVTFASGASSAGEATGVFVKVETTTFLDVTDGTIDSTGNASYDLDLTVTAGTKNKLIFTGQPSASTVANVAIATQPIVSIEDTYGNVTADTDTVTLAGYTEATCTTAVTLGTVGGTLTEAAVAGVANFTGNGVKYTASTNSLYFKATSGALTSACTTPAITIIPAAPTLVCSASGQAGSVWLSWTVPYGVKTSLATYEGQRAAGSSNTWDGASNVAFGTTWTAGTVGTGAQQLVTGMNPGSQYTFRMHTLGNNSTESGDSNAVSCYSPYSIGSSIDKVNPTSYVTYPAANSKILSGDVVIKGTAQDSGGSSVQKVEVSVNGGTNWVLANVKAGDEGTNVTWEYTWKAESGTHTIKTRAYDWTGNIEDAGAGITVTATADASAVTTTTTSTTTQATTSVTSMTKAQIETKINELRSALVQLLMKLLTALQEQLKAKQL